MPSLCCSLTLLLIQQNSSVCTMIYTLHHCCRETAFGALRAWPGGLQLGGGVNLDNARVYLDAGASHVIVTSFVFRDGQLEEDRLKALVSHQKAVLQGLVLLLM
eukprot:GHUV01056867.1.p3 GENE.GHUV01056867.1~~GHUV01056867.1.p3  ORF type:complete len:104 (+),score=11.92 GHUV01056867.1:189-500(+)